MHVEESDIQRVDVPRLLNEQEVSHLYSVSLAYLRKKRLASDGPPYLRIGRMVRYRLQDVEDFFNSHLVSNPPEQQ